MAWGRIDDNLALHPKVLQAGNEAIGLWVRALSYSCQQLTDGHVSNTIVDMIGSRALADRLVTSGLWHEVEDGYQFNDWHDYQPSREAVLAERAAARARMAKVRGKKKANESDVREKFGRTSGEVQEKFGRSSDYVRAPHPIPSHPRTTSNEVVLLEPKKTKKGSRIPEPFVLTGAMAKWAEKNVPGFNYTAETERFIDYWRAAPGERGVKADWQATWRNWIRRANDDAKSRGGVKPTAAQRGLMLVAQLEAEQLATQVGGELTRD